MGRGRRIVNQALLVVLVLGCILFFLYVPKILYYWQRDDRSLNVYMFADFIAPEAFREFERKTGIAVNVQFYDTNEELYAKLKMTGGAGYDVINPSDYMVEFLKKDGLLQKIDYTQIPNAQLLDERLLKRYFDSCNEYSIPMSWSVYGILYDRTIFCENQYTLGLDVIFKDPRELVASGVVKYPYKVCMFDEPRDVTLIAALYLFGTIHDICDEQLLAIERLLIEQRSWLESYTNFGLRYFFEGNIVAFATTISRYARHVLNIDSSRFGFCVPREGGFMVIENFAIPAASAKRQWAQQFIDFMISEKMCLQHFTRCGGNPVHKGAYSTLKSMQIPYIQSLLCDEQFDRLLLMHNEIPVSKTSDIWLRVKTA